MTPDPEEEARERKRRRRVDNSALLGVFNAIAAVTSLVVGLPRWMSAAYGLAAVVSGWACWRNMKKPAPSARS